MAASQLERAVGQAKSQKESGQGWLGASDVNGTMYHILIAVCSACVPDRDVDSFLPLL